MKLAPKLFLLMMLCAMFATSQAVPVIYAIHPDSAAQNQYLTVSISGQDTHFLQGSQTTMWLSQGSSTIDPILTSAAGDRYLYAKLRIPADAAMGLWDVNAYNSLDGTVTLTGGFTITPIVIPEITAINPDIARLGDTLDVTITGQGTNFYQGSDTTVWLSQGSDTINANSFYTYWSETSLDANFSIPVDAAAGYWDVNVYNNLDETVTLTDGFCIISGTAELINVTPNVAEAGQSLFVSMTGSDTFFIQGYDYATFDVWFSQGSSTIEMDAISIYSDTSLEVATTIPLDAAGTWDVHVYDDMDGIITLTDGFAINGLPGIPQITAIAPDTAQQGDTLDVTIYGQDTYFAQGSDTTVWFSQGSTADIWFLQGSGTFDQGSSTILANNFYASNDLSLSANFSIPHDAAIGDWNVRVYNNLDGMLKMDNGFAVTPPPIIPQITSIAPGSALQSETLDVTITGQDTLFLQGSDTQVWFSQGSSTINANSLTVYSDTSLSANLSMPANAQGDWDVSVYNMIDNTVTMPDGFTVTIPYHAGLQGSGTSNDPFLIEDFADFQEFCNNSDYWTAGVYTRLECDLNLSETGIYIQAPIAPSNSYKFAGIEYKGHFDGNEHIISHLTIDRGGIGYFLALFGKIGSGASVRNLGLEDVYVVGESSIAGLAGGNEGSVEKCFVTGYVYGSTNRVGGLIGHNFLYCSGDVTECYSACTVGGNANYVGGLIGESEYMTNNIANCYSSGSVSGNIYVGGLIGRIYRTKVGNCYSTCSVAGSSYVGGLLGQSFYAIVRNSYSAGSVSGSDTHVVGGLIGSGSNNSVANCFWDKETSGLTYSAGGIGKTTEQMQTESTFIDAGWDLIGESANGTADTWWPPVSDYPRLSMECPFEIAGDVNYDCKVNLEDLSMLAQSWMLDCHVTPENCLQ